ncbi:dihydroorotate oxidase [Enterococcus faecium P1123]|uniref:dihydroorotate oxidase (fumarate) n=11 Tax=Enterococcus TaxID=1350 RepID=I3U217_ENTFD|nr:dihydroorotate oxidase [Enterococcus faecium DO]EFR71976.1 dihydroorotate oxidase [Enterococcus faecium TX0133B]EFR75578.1 dihydroorotate oxidase [Enterococcus faecium TX0133A]EFR76161.1 dihydroorotate oxidase [Enterococcus faecium TX0133C]EFS06613.1 dihydroorotate oxidase [Enterococcus faecium TX0133a04]EFS07924.1 dihydroorotate oxidase [Enterococcus faecium TX0082]EJX38672.1 dihydroorotate oxidase [Enterococcus faecium R501]EJX46615.1 dihydroorotate oxidase [Enterococcus faecium S447]E
MTTQELDELAHSEAGAFITKSCTINERKGNPEPRYFDVPLGSINSMGLPNLGFSYYLEYALAYEKVQENQNQPLFFSIAGMSVQENLEMLEKIEKSGFNGITELNLSCPNVPGKPQLAYDFEATYETLKEVFSIFSKPLGIKLPPYFDFAHFDQMADILNQFPLTYVNAINSVGNGLYIDTEQEAVVIKPKEGFGGIGGEYIKPTALANVRAFYTRLKPEIQIIGTGGIRTGQDAFEHLLCGASMLQIGTELHKEGPEIFSRIIKELTQIMSEKGYTSIDEFKGKLRTIS